MLYWLPYAAYGVLERLVMQTLVQLVAMVILTLGIGIAGFLLLRRILRGNTLKRLERIGVPTEATVVQVRDHQLLFGLEVGTGEDEARSYFVVYEYDAVDKKGKTHHLSREEAINEEWYNRLSPDQRIPIHYLRANPKLARIDGNRWYVMV